MSSPFSIVVLISGSGSNLQSIIDAVASAQIKARIGAVISNNAQAYGLERARQHNISHHLVEHKLFANREEFEHKLQQVIDQHQPDLIVLAGFMRILTAPFVEHYTGKMLNIHPSLLPDYKGINTHQRVLEQGAKIHGVSVHFVTPELDGGPIIAQARVAVYPDDSVAVLAKRVLIQEHRLYPIVIQWFVEKRLMLVEGKVQFDNARLPKAIVYK